MSARRHESFDAGWAFIQEDVPGAEAPTYDDSAWRRVDLPHDWSIEGPFREDHPSGGGGGYLPGGIGWYRKAFTVPEEDATTHVTVMFDGVYKNCDVWINGHHLGFHPYGYTSFWYDLTPHLRPGATNVLAVRVDDSQKPDARWYTGSGIYRHVWLTVTDPLHIAPWGTYVTTPMVTAAEAAVSVRTRIVNASPETRICTLRTTVYDAAGTAVASAERQHAILASEEHEAAQVLQVFTPHLWSIADPYLYLLRSEILDGADVIDSYDTPFGIREIAFDADRGFLLNGERVKINGVCLHHDGGCVGAAVPEGVWERRLRLLKAMGCNGIRSSHYPPAPEFLDLCDRLGFVVMDEAFDEWRQEHYLYGPHDYFDEWGEADLKSMLYRDRNHPSIVLWSVGNEILEQTRPEGVTILKRLVDIVHAIDPTRPVTSACDKIDAPYTGSGPTLDAFLDTLDVVGYNYVDRWGERREKAYSIDRERHPHRRVIGSENVSVSGIRGHYQLEPDTTGTLGLWRRGSYYASMIQAENLWKFTRSHDYVAGDFMWTGIDYLGEARWPHKNSSSGVIDMCGFPKDGYYFYQSQWTETPMVHLFPHWTWPGHEGRIIPVVCYTNCDSVELFLNGRSYGVKSYAPAFRGFDRTKGFFEQTPPPAWPTTSDLHLTWDLPYEPGTLRAVGMKDGQVVCVQEVVTAGAPARIALEVDRSSIVANGHDVAHVTVRVLDAQGTLVPVADHEVAFTVEGEGTLIGVDNGNPASHEPFQATRRQAFHGLCLAIVQATRAPGEVRVAAASQGLQGDSVTITTTRA
ncbi:MAG TPA: DUF4982 domain-containing protein [Chloroflexi bacterium]|jgi:beta-galactosidase|nr:DUF4982 domain-containing protein [Chloroflexota bacterium]